MVMPSLILQRTSNKCKMSEIKSHVERRSNLWKNMDVEGLLNETRTIQKSLPQWQKPQTTEEKAKIFTCSWRKGKCSNSTSGWWYQEWSFAAFSQRDKNFHQKHPDTKPSNDTMMFHGPFNHINEIIFDGINADLVRKCAIRIKGSHGPSGLDANFWSKILCNSTFVNDQTISVTL